MKRYKLLKDWHMPNRNIPAGTIYEPYPTKRSYWNSKYNHFVSSHSINGSHGWFEEIKPINYIDMAYVRSAKEALDKSGAKVPMNELIDFVLSENRKPQQPDNPPSTSAKEWHILTLMNHTTEQICEASIYRDAEERVRNFPASFSIHSVRRLSDNVIFTVGDKIEYRGHLEDWSMTWCGTIGKFKVLDNHLTIFIKGENNEDNASKHIENIRHLSPTPTPQEQDKPVLGTTYDGVKVYDKMQFISIVDEDFKQWDTNALNCTWNEKRKYFSTKELAEQFVLENKPLLKFN